MTTGWEEHDVVALVTFYFRGKDNELGHEAKYGPPILMNKQASEAEQQAFYEALLRIPWLSLKLRRAVMLELGISPRERQREIQHARARMTQALIREGEVRIRKGRKRSSGDRFHGDAVEAIARFLNMKVEALEKLIKRHGLKSEQLRKLESDIDQQGEQLRKLERDGA